MQNSVIPMAELFTFKLQNFRNNVNDLGENYWVILTSSFIYHRKGKVKCFRQNFCVRHV